MKKEITFRREQYILKRAYTRNKEITFQISPLDEEKQSALSCKTRLIYVVKDQEEVLYVGEAKSALKTRLARGFTAYRHFKRTNKARGGYKGYKWIQLFENEQAPDLNADAFIFDESFNDKNRRYEIEAIEGEIVYMVRKKTGKWPIWQNEIHFSNSEEAIYTATKIVQLITQE